MPAPFEELTGSPRVEGTLNSFQAVRKFKIDWDRSIEFYQDLMGYWTNAGGSLSYIPPATFPGIPDCWCRRVTFDPFPEDYIVTGSSSDLLTNTNQPKYAIVSATYTIEPPGAGLSQPNSSPSIPEGTYLTINVDVGTSSQARSGAASGLHYGSPSKKVKDATDVHLIPTDNITMSWQRIPLQLIPFDKIREMRGRVNAEKFWIYEKQEVLFQGAQLQYNFQMAGGVICTLHYKFMSKTVTKLASNQTVSGWTHLYIVDDNVGDFFEVKNYQGHHMYKDGDFSQLFTYA